MSLAARAARPRPGLLRGLVAATSLSFAAASVARAEDGDCRITAYGAKAGDEALDTDAIQRAIDTCAARGGGRVVVPAGRFVTGTIILKSGIELHVEPGAVLSGSPRIADYPRIEGKRDDHSAAAQGVVGRPASGEDTSGNHALVYAKGASGVSLTGSGVVDGNGPAFWGEGFLASGRARPDLPRPRPWIWFRDCERVTVRDVTLRDSPSYFLTFEASEDVLVEGIRIRAHPLSPNSDGIQIDGGRDVRIHGASIRTGDDAIVLKASGAPVTHVTVSQVYLESDDSAFKLGTGSAHPIRHVRFADSQIANSRIGIALFMKDGGVYEHLDFEGLTISTASRHSTDYPIYVDLDRRTPDSALGRIRHVRIASTRIESRGNVLIGGHPDRPIEDVTLQDVTFVVRDPVDVRSVKGKPRGNVLLAGQVPGADFAQLNAHVTAGHVGLLALQGLVVEGASPEANGARSLLWLAGVRDATLRDVVSGPRSGSWPLVSGRVTGSLSVDGLDAGSGTTAAFALEEPPARFETRGLNLRSAALSAPGAADPGSAKKGPGR